MIQGVISDEMVELIEKLNTLPMDSPEWGEAIKRLGVLKLEAEKTLHTPAAPTQPPVRSGVDQDAQKCPNCSNTLWKLNRFEDAARVVTRDQCLVCNYIDSATEETEIKEA